MPISRVLAFEWPYLLLVLLIPPVLLAVHLYLQRRRQRFAVSYASLSIIRDAMPRTSSWRRRVPLALFLVALVSLGVAAARPQAVVAVPINRMSIILAIDVSRSMCATDVAPNRLAVAQEVAQRFVKDQQDGARIGIVAFAGTAQIVVPVTKDRKAATAAIEGFTAGRGTAIGTALLRSIDAIAESNPDIPRSGVDLAGNAGTAGAKLAPGTHRPDIIVLLTDGATTQGVDPVRAADQAADRGLRVYTIGFGTTEPAQLVCSRQQLGSDVFQGGFGAPGGFGGDVTGGPRRRILSIDEPTLRTVAEKTGGSYHRAQDADELVRVFRDLPGEITIEEQETEISFAFALLGGALAAVALALSLAWNRYA